MNYDIFASKDTLTAELLIKSWEPSTLKNRPPLAFSTINGHRSMLNKLLLLRNQTYIANYPFITRILTGIHNLSPSFANYQEIWDYTALLNKTLVLCKMFGLARSSDLVKWSFNGLIITPDSIKGPVINAKKQRKGRRKSDSDDSVFIQNEGKPLDVKEINIIVLSTLSSSGVDISNQRERAKKSKTNSIQTKTIDFSKNAATDVIFMNLFTIHYSQNGVDPTLKTIMDNGAASNELFQLLQPTHNESVKNNDKIEGETLKKLIHRNFRFKTLVTVKTDYEAANIKVVDAISNRNCYSAQDVIKNIEAIMSYISVINRVYLIHSTHEVQFEYLRSILDINILALLKMVVPDRLKTDVAIKLNTQTDITECHEPITELVLNNTDKFSRRPSDSTSNTVEKIRAETLPKLKKSSKVDIKNVRSSFIVYRENKSHCLNCSGDQQHDVHKNINKFKEYIKDSYGIKLVPDTTVPIPKAVESEMKHKPQNIEFNTPIELTMLMIQIILNSNK
ncbi:hypothetical protein ACTFIW_008791 [Dictyostelium discoideum]